MQSTASPLPTLLTSRAPCEAGAKNWEETWQQQQRALPEEYALPIRVRNTFIDTSAERAPSLERFLQNREVSTCPSAHVGRLRNLFREPDFVRGGEDCKPAATTPETRSVSAGSPSAAASSPRAKVLALSEVLGASCQQWDEHAGRSQAWVEGPSSAVDIGLSYCGFPLEETPAPLTAITEQHCPPPPPDRPALGTEEMPSVGSAGHADGTCKPCAFLHTVGCANGLSCQFCHLCDSEERKRRRKAKIEARRAERQRAGAAGWGSARGRA